MKTKGQRQSKNIERMLPGQYGTKIYGDDYQGSIGKSKVFGKLKSSYDKQYSEAQKRSKKSDLFMIDGNTKDSALRQTFRPQASRDMTRMANTVAHKGQLVGTNGPGVRKMKEAPTKTPTQKFGLKPVQTQEKRQRKSPY